MVNEITVPDLRSNLVDREEELTELATIFKKTLEGHGSTIFIAGEAGVGKTRLVEELIERVEDEDAKIIKGCCLADSLKPFLSVKEALRNSDLYHLIAEEPPPKVISTYLITKTGLLVSKSEREESELDADIFASMLNAVQNFVKDSLSFMGEGEGSSLNSITYGDHDILIQSVGSLSLAMVIEGTSSEFLIDDMKSRLREMGEELGEWNGSSKGTENIEPMVDWFIDSGKYEGKYLVDDAKLRKENFFDNVLLGLHRLSKERPILFFIDDLQWADPSSLALLHYLSRNTKNDRMMILGTYRPEDVVDEGSGDIHDLKRTMQNMSREGLFEEIKVERLGEKDIERFLDISLKEVDFEPRFIQRIYEESGGNPFFLIELTKLLIEEDHIAKEEGIWVQAESLDEIHIPTKIYDVVIRRLNRLIREQRDILECASVVGEEFDSRVIGDLTGLNRIELLKNLGDIEKTHKLIHSLGKKYRFDHKKIREVLYDDINSELRQEYHRITAESYEALYPDEDVVEQLGHHYLMAEDSRAVDYFIELGDRAKEGYSNKEAIDYYSSALSFIHEEDEMYRTLKTRIGDLNSIIGMYDEAITNYDEVLDLEEDDQEIAKVLEKKGEVYLNRGEFEKARDLTDRGLSLSEKNTVERCRLLGTKAESYNNQGEYDRAREILIEQKKIAEDLGLDEERAEALKNLGISSFRQGDYDKAVQYLQESIDISEGMEDVKKVADAYQNLGLIYGNQEKLDEALKNYEIALENYEKIGDVRGKAYVYKSIGVAYRIMGEYDESLEYQMKSNSIAHKIGDMKGLSSTYQNIGIVYYDKGELKKTLEYFDKSSELMEYMGDKQGLAWSYNNMGVLYNLMGDLDRSLENYKKSLDLKREMGDTYGEASSLYNLGSLYFDRGEYERAEDYHLESLELCKELDEKVLEVENNCFLSKISMERGEIERSIELAEKALDITRETGIKQVEGMSLITLGEAYRQYGEIKKAEALYEEAKHVYEDSGDKKGMAELLYYQALLRIDKGEKEEAVELFKRAKEMFGEASMELWVERVHEKLEET